MHDRPPFASDTFLDTSIRFWGDAASLSGEFAPAFGQFQALAADPDFDAALSIGEPGVSLAEAADRSLADWWTDEAATRAALWAVAAAGQPVALDWIAWMVARAQGALRPRFASLLALDLVDIARVNEGVTAATEPDSSSRSRESVEAWLSNVGVRVAATVAQGHEGSGSGSVSAAWLSGRRVDAESYFDAMWQAAIVGDVALVVELDQRVQRRVLVPCESTDDWLADADLYCVDVASRRGGWLNRFGVWIWDLADPDRPPPGVERPNVGAGQ